MLITEFKNQSVRDLAWAISMPPLIMLPQDLCCWPKSDWFQSAFLETLPWFKKLDQDSSSLDILLSSQKDKRLGKYFEILWFYWLSNHPRYEVLEHNLQIIIDGETLGEMDFILFDKKNKQVLHWELAVKFYLGIGNTSKMNNWHGPNLRDRLDIKVNHLQNKQSVISRDPRVAEWLQNKGIVIDYCGVILKGRLYYHWSQLSGGDRDRLLENNSTGEVEKSLLSTPLSVQSPAISTEDHLQSIWFRQSEFEQVFDNDDRVLPLIKSGWLQSLTTGEDEKIISVLNLFKTLSKNELRLPLHLQLFQEDIVIDSVFLVDENWSKSH